MCKCPCRFWESICVFLEVCKTPLLVPIEQARKHGSTDTDDNGILIGLSYVRRWISPDLLATFVNALVVGHVCCLADC